MAQAIYCSGGEKLRYSVPTIARSSATCVHNWMQWSQGHSKCHQLEMIICALVSNHEYYGKWLREDMPTLGPATSPQQRESFHLDRGSRVVWSEVEERNCNTLHPVRSLRVGWKILMDNNKFQREIHLPCQEGLLLLGCYPQATTSPSVGIA